MQAGVTGPKDHPFMVPVTTHAVGGKGQPFGETLKVQMGLGAGCD